MKRNGFMHLQVFHQLLFIFAIGKGNTLFARFQKCNLRQFFTAPNGFVGYSKIGVLLITCFKK